MMHSQRIVRDIQDANPKRSPENLQRRLVKVMEELGEASEAYLSKTGPDNYKAKSWADYREESVDILIVLVDVALTSLPDNTFPPSSLLPNHIRDASLNRIQMDQLEDRKFVIAKCIATAYEGLKERPPMSFYGAIGRAVKAAAEMVYAVLPEGDGDIQEEVLGIVTTKLDKWRTRMALLTQANAGEE